MMGFGASVASGLRKYFTIAGRAPRAEYWFFTLFTILVSVVASGLDTVLFGAALLEGAAIEAIASYALIVPSITVLIRRFHDIGKSGWHAVSVLLGLFLGAFSALFAGASGNTPGLILGLVVLAAAVIYLLFGTLKASDPAPNDFGPNPYAFEGKTLDEVFE